MSYPPAEPPRVRVHLPGDTPARLHRWRQDERGRWWAEVTVYAPAHAVQRVDGEDYTAVPREPADTRYVLQTLRHSNGDTPALVLHVAGCWAAEGQVQDVETEGQAAGLLQFGDTSACEVCQPTPRRTDAPPQEGNS